MAKYHRQLNLTLEERYKFKRRAIEEMQKKHLTVPKLADEIKYSRKTVWQFFNDHSLENKYLSAAIEDYFDLEWR